MVADPTTVSLAGPKGYPIIGSLPEFISNKLEFFSRCAREYGEFVPLKLGSMNACLITGPALIEEVLVVKHRAFIKDLAIQKSHRTLGEGLLTSEGEHWKRQRRLSQPAFHRARIAGYAVTMTEHTEQMLTEWRNDEVRDINAEMMKLTLSIVAKTLFDIDSSEQAREIGKLVTILVEHFAHLINSGFLIPEWLPIPENIRFKRAINKFDDYIKKAIKVQRQAELNSTNLLSILLQAQEDGGMTDSQLLDEVKTLFLAGHETTANALSWTWLLLARHPEVADKLLKELSAIPLDRPISMEDLPQLSYLEAVVTESMRLYPPVWNMGREAVEDVEIGGHKISAGTTVLISTWVVHHDSRYFAEPDRFIPERWQNEFQKSLPTFAYFPFGGGPRLCIGKYFALTEAMIILASILRRYEIELLPDQQILPEPSITLRPVPGIKVRLKKR